MGLIFMQIPAHLLHTDWAGYELSVLNSLSQDIRKAIAKLDEKLSTNRVHVARVTIRRWQSICKILDADGLYVEHYELAKQNLRKLRKDLGKIRDLEVLIDMSQNFDLPKGMPESWAQRCEKRRKKLAAGFDPDPIKKHLKKLEREIEKTRRPSSFFVPARALRTSGMYPVPDRNDSAFGHLEPYLRKLEDQTHEIERKAFSPTQLHELRISIKSWRYFLTEFYGLTNLQLVRAQQILGKVHDIDHMLELLNEDNRIVDLGEERVDRISDSREKLLQEFGKFRKHLPYGLRPEVVSRAGVPEPVEKVDDL